MKYLILEGRDGEEGTIIGWANSASEVITEVRRLLPCFDKIPPMERWNGKGWLWGFETVNKNGNCGRFIKARPVHHISKTKPYQDGEMEPCNDYSNHA